MSCNRENDIEIREFLSDIETNAIDLYNLVYRLHQRCLKAENEASELRKELSFYNKIKASVEGSTQ